MAVTETTMAIGSWSLRLRANTPKEIMNALVPFGHVAIMPGRIDVKAAGDGLLRAARYVGVFRSLFAQPEDYEIKGPGMGFWLGDEDDKGYVFRTGTFTAGFGFTSCVSQVLGPAPSVSIGSIYPPTPDPNLAFSRNLKTPRALMDYLCSTYGTSVAPVEWRVNGDATVDAGLVSSLYPSTANPTALLVRRDGGKEIGLSTVEGSMSLDVDASDLTTQVILAAEGSGGATVYASASAAATPYRDLLGNPVVLTRIVSESDTPALMAQIRATIALSKYTSLRYASQLSTDEYDVKGTFGAGDTIYVHDVDAGFIDPANQIMHNGVPINPYKLRVSEVTWSVPAYWTVAYRGPDGTWYDLSDYYAPEQGSSTVTVGQFLESVGGSYQEPLGSRPNGDSSVPNTPVFGTITTAAYQSDTSKTGDTRAQINASWSLPINADGTAIVDGAYYRLRFRPKFATGSDWTETMVSWGTNQTVLMELNPGTTYSLQIRAEDLAVPPNVSAFSSSTDVVTAFDGVAPSQPAAPAVAGSRIAVQITHTLGKAAGGTYNLETDLDHLEVHNGASSTFTPTSATLLGNLTANIGLMLAAIPAVGTLNIESTAATWFKIIAVDRSGNKSTASPAASATALLIDNAHISDLTVSKVTAGTIGATWINAGTITTASAGARVEMVGAGLNAYNSGGTKTVEIKGSDGSATITGAFKTGFAGGGSPYLQMTDSGDRTTIDFMNSTASANLSAFMNSPQDAGNSSRIGINTGAFTYIGAATRSRLFLNNDQGIQLESYRLSGGAVVGGQLTLTSNFTSMTMINPGSSNGSAAKVNTTTSGGTVRSELALFDDGSVWMSGRMTKDNAIGGIAAVFSGSWNVNANGGATVTFGSTMGTTMWTMVSLGRNNTVNYDWHVLDSSTTAFSFWGPNTTAEFTYWGQRLI
jgi:hypothetical protein